MYFASLLSSALSYRQLVGQENCLTFAKWKHGEMKTFSYANLLNAMDVLPNDTPADTKKVISKHWSPYGLKPRFYSENEVSNFLKVVSEIRGTEELYVSDNLYTFLPKIDLPPVPKEYSVREADKYGYFLMNPLQFLLRPDIDNVYSCHSIREHSDTIRLAGNLGYLQSPFWGCVGVYQRDSKQSKTYTRIDAFDHLLTIDGDELHDSLNCPSLIATFNIALTFSDIGHPVLMLSRIYGSVDFEPSRFFEYVVNTLKTSFSFNENWCHPSDDDDAKKGFWGGCSNFYVKTTAKNTVYIPQYVPQVVVKGSNDVSDLDNFSLVARYEDIELVRINTSKPAYTLDELHKASEVHEVYSADKFGPNEGLTMRLNTSTSTLLRSDAQTDALLFSLQSIGDKDYPVVNLRNAKDARQCVSCKNRRKITTFVEHCYRGNGTIESVRLCKDCYTRSYYECLATGFLVVARSYYEKVYVELLDGSVVFTCSRFMEALQDYHRDLGLEPKFKAVSFFAAGGYRWEQVY